MAFESFTHAIHGQFSLPPQDALLRQSLIAVSGRLIAIGAGNHIHLYDSHDVSNVSAVLGTGSCKFRFLCSFPVMDISDSVTVTSLLFLRGGHLALSGLCAKGTVIHAYKLLFTCSPSQPSSVLQGPTNKHTIPTIELDTLPQLVFRAALKHPDHLVSSALPTPRSVVHLFAHPTLNHTLGVILNGDYAIRFFDCGVTPDAAVPTTTDSGSGMVPHPYGPNIRLIRAAVSRDGQVLVATTDHHELAVFGLTTKEDTKNNPRKIIEGTYIRSYLCESEPTALCIANIPTHPDAHLYSQFRYNGYLIITGHSNGFVNLWWGGNTPTVTTDTTTTTNEKANKKDKHNDTIAPPSVPSKNNTGKGTGTKAGHVPVKATLTAPSTSQSTLPPPHPTVSLSSSPSTMVSVPVASYPPFHASRGAIMHISPAFCIETGTEQRKHVEMFQSLVGSTHHQTNSSSSSFSSSSTAKLGSNISTVFCIGAYGARGWRVFELPHLPVPTVLHTGGSRTNRNRTTGASAPTATTLAAPDTIKGSWSYDARGRKVYVPPPPADVSHLLHPLVDFPTYTDCMRSPVIGDAQWKSTTSQPLSSSSSLQQSTTAETGIDPRGAVLLQRYPSADTFLLPSFCTEGSTADDDYGNYTNTANSLYPGLPPSSITPDKSIFRLMGKTVNGLVSSESAVFTTDEESSTKENIPVRDGFPHLPSGTVLRVPRTIVLFLTERGLHAAGFDHGPSLVANIKPHTMAAHARHVDVPELSRVNESTRYVTNNSASSSTHGDTIPETMIPDGRYNRTKDIWASTDEDTTNTTILNQTNTNHTTNNTTTSNVLNVTRKTETNERFRRHHRTGTAKVFHPHAKPQYPMAITGRHDSFIRGLRATFDIEESDELRKKRSTSKERRSIEREHQGTKIGTVNRNENLTNTDQPPKVLSVNIPSKVPVKPPTLPKEVKKEDVEAPLTEIQLKYVPRHTAERLLAKQQQKLQQQQQQQMKKKEEENTII